MGQPHGLYFFFKKKKKAPLGLERPRSPLPESVYMSALWEGCLPESWFLYQLFGRNPFQQAGMYTSLSERIPSDKLVYRSKPSQQAGMLKKLRIFAGDRGKRPGDEKTLRKRSEGKNGLRALKEG
jgi:hypothetical protein